MKQIIVEDIPIEITKKRIKNMYLRVLPPKGNVNISAPVRMTEEAIYKFAMSKVDWIRTQQQKIQNQHLQEEISYLTGDEIYFWGNRYVIKVEPKCSSGKVVLSGNHLVLRTKAAATEKQREAMVNAFYREALNEKIPDLITKWENIIHVKANSWNLRNMKTRWGTCNVKKNHICLNLQLAKKPLICLEYVIVHELVHLLEGSHNHIFKSYMDQFLPEWRRIKKEMNGNGNL